MLQDFVEAVEKLIDTRINELHTAVPAEIISFDAQNSTAAVKPWGKIVLSDGREIPYPQINDVPVMFPRSGQDVAIAFPVKKGDGCLLIISEQALDYWKSNGIQNSEIKYSLTNAVALPGLFAKPTGDMTEAMSSGDVIVKNGNTSIRLSRSQIAIKGDLTVEGNLTTTKQLKGLQGVYNASGEITQCEGHTT